MGYINELRKSFEAVGKVVLAMMAHVRPIDVAVPVVSGLLFFIFLVVMTA